MGSGGGQVRVGVTFPRANAVGELVGAGSQETSQHGERTGPRRNEKLHQSCCKPLTIS